MTVTKNDEIGAWIEGDHQQIDPEFDLSDILLGTNGNDKIRGGAGNDELFGFGGRDVLYSGSGFNFLDGGQDPDLLISRGESDRALLGRGDVLVAKGVHVDTRSSGDLVTVFALSGKVDLQLGGSCSIPDDHIDPRRSALFMARSILREVREGVETC